MVLILVSTTISLGLVWAFRRLARSSHGTGGVLALALVTTLLFGCVFSTAVALQSLLTAVLAVGCLVFRASPRRVGQAAVAAMVVSYAAMFWSGINEVRTNAKLRQQYPMVSLSDRLAYEDARRPQRGPEQPPGDSAREDSPATAHSSPPLAPDVQARLQEFEWRWDHGRSRLYMLNALHDRTHDEFVLARGFGPVRMLGVHAERIHLPAVEPVPLPTPPETDAASPEGSSPDRDAHELAAAGDEVRSDLGGLHAAGALDFLERERMGYIRDRDHVAGFQSHGFSAMPGEAPVNGLARETTSLPWQIVRLELVSLLAHETPVAYVSKNLPQMDELKRVPTRPLDDFERQAIERLVADEDVVVEDTPERIRMVGSLRAAKDCLKCHAGNHGELLGAFTYELLPKNAVRRSATSRTSF